MAVTASLSSVMILFKILALRFGVWTQFKNGHQQLIVNTEMATRRENVQFVCLNFVR